MQERLSRGCDSMSMVICKDCEILVDSDDDPDCFVYVGDYKRQHSEITLCRACRDRLDDDAIPYSLYWEVEP